MRLLPVPRGDDGPDLAVMRAPDRSAAPTRPRLYVTVSVLHNPTGASLPLAAGAPGAAAGRRARPAHRRGRHLRARSRRRTRRGWPRSTACERTIYVSGFSKILAPNWRVGFLAAPPALVERLLDTKLLTTLTTPAAPEQALARCLEQGALRRHAERVLRAARRRARPHRAAGRRRRLPLRAPPRGLFGWVDAGVDTERLAAALLDEGWLLAPGALFHAAPRPTHADARQLRDRAGRALLARALVERARQRL